MEINEIIRVRIIDTNENGVGIAKYDGAVVFAKGTVCGDLCDVRIISHEKNYYTAEVSRMIEKSEYRISPECDKFSECGGCTLSNVTYEYENEIKKKSIMSALRRSGLEYSIVEDTVFCSERKHYRNNVTLHYNGEYFGYYSEKTNTPTEFGKCKLSPAEFHAIADTINANAKMLRECTPTDIHIRNNSINEIIVSIYVKNSVPDSVRNEFTDKIMECCKSIRDVNFVCSGRGASYIEDDIAGIKMRFSSEAFRQVNTPAFEKLLEIVCEIIRNLDFEFASDLYCGSGIIGLKLAKMFPERKFIGIEINPDSIRDAKYNAKKNNINNIEFYTGDSASLLDRIHGKGLPEMITVDPPRAGLSKKVCSDIVKISPNNLIYVSCNPQTLVRDLKYFNDNGYVIKRVIPVNLFPFTKHCECVVWLTRD